MIACRCVCVCVCVRLCGRGVRTIIGMIMYVFLRAFAHAVPVLMYKTDCKLVAPGSTFVTVCFKYHAVWYSSYSLWAPLWLSYDSSSFEAHWQPSIQFLPRFSSPFMSPIASTGSLIAPGFVHASFIWCKISPWCGTKTDKTPNWTKTDTTGHKYLITSVLIGLIAWFVVQWRFCDLEAWPRGQCPWAGASWESVDHWGMDTSNIRMKSVQKKESFDKLLCLSWFRHFGVEKKTIQYRMQRKNILCKVRAS